MVGHRVGHGLHHGLGNALAHVESAEQYVMGFLSSYMLSAMQS